METGWRRVHQHTVSVGTADWLAATRDMKITAYVEDATFVSLGSSNDDAFTSRQFLHDLTKVHATCRAAR